MNKFKIKGKIISYGTSSNKDYIDVLVGKDTITIFLAKNNLSEYEHKYDLQEHDLNAKGYIKQYNDVITLIATKIKII